MRNYSLSIRSIGIFTALVSATVIGCGDDTSDETDDTVEADSGMQTESESSGETASDSDGEPTASDAETDTASEGDETDTESSETEATDTSESDTTTTTESSDEPDASTSTSVEPEAGTGATETISAEPDAGTSATETSALDAGPDGGEVDPNAITYYQHVLPIFEQNCVTCHQSGGLGPFDITDFATASALAALIEEETAERKMPPNLITNDGTCGEFTSKWLSEEDLGLIAAWAAGGALEGEPREAVVDPIPVLTDSVDVLTPEFSPVAGGGVLDLNDEYRCFLSDFTTQEELEFVTGFNVIPGNDKLVHHVLGFMVDMDADSDVDGLTNAELIEQMDTDSPDRDGWPCFGMAGEGVDVEAVPVSWAPGQGVVTYPDDSGIVFTPNRRLVLQLHYNLEDPETVGQSDETTVQLQVKAAEDVDNVGIFLLHDPLLSSLDDPEPTLLAPGEESVLYTWEDTFEGLGLPAQLPAFNFYGVMPHMHELGHKYTLELLPAETPDAPICAAKVNEWDFHWQHLYFYTEPLVLTPADSVRVTCDYDTSEKTEPVLPGWGTRNEMCLGNFYVTLPKILLGL